MEQIASNEALEKFRVVGLSEDSVNLLSGDAEMTLAKSGYPAGSIAELFELKFGQQIELSHERNDSDKNTIEFYLKDIAVQNHDIVRADFHLNLDKDTSLDLLVTAYKSYFTKERFGNDLKINNRFVFRFVI